MDDKTNMINKELFNRRLEELNWTIYTLARRYRDKKGMPTHPVSRYHSTVMKLMGNPGRSKTENVLTTIELLGGEVSIEWGTPPIVSSIEVSYTEYQEFIEWKKAKQQIND